jgi:hypothetical protein
MQQRLLMILSVLLLAAAACQNQPPTQIVVVVTATVSDSTAEAVPLEATETAPGVAVTASPTPPTPRATPTTDPLPTPVISQIQVAEQVFENGRMFWLQPVDQIWVMIVTSEGQGDWSVYQDTFEEGEPESDTSLTPEAGFQQPERGFGKLWRENPDVREALGWAITPEFGYVTRYEYHRIAPDRADGFHLLTSLYEETFRFNEADSTWQLN